jgi:hypothetical protein
LTNATAAATAAAVAFTTAAAVMSQAMMPPPLPPSPPAEANARDQQMAQEYLNDRDAMEAADAAAAAEADELESRRAVKRTSRMIQSYHADDDDNNGNDDDNDDDDDDDDDQQASQALVNDEPKEWENGTARPYAIPHSEMPQPTLANMLYKLQNGSIHVRLDEKTKDHVFTLMNDNLGKPILLFAPGMGKLINSVLPEAYKAYDENLHRIENLEDGKVVYTNTFVVSKYVKNLVEVGVWMGKLNISLKRMGKPEAYQNSPFNKSAKREPYNGPIATPDKDGFVFIKGGSLAFDRYIDDPAKLLIWAMKCRSMPY